MTLTIDVSPDLEQRLRDLAAERGLSVDDFVRGVLAARAAPIVRDPERCAGDPILSGTRTAVHEAVSYARRFNWDLERVQSEALPHLSLDQVHAAITWYREHSEEIDAILVRTREDYARGLADRGYTPGEEKALQALHAAGLLKEIKPRGAGRKVERPLVPIQGKPLSETISEERR